MRTACLTLVFLVQGLARTALAQGALPAATAQAPMRPAIAPPTSGLEENAASVSNPEKLKRSADALARMQQVLREVLTKLEEARNTKDVVKLNCVNEKLVQIKGLLRISEQSDVSLQESVAKQESATADHEFTKVTIARQKVEQLRGEAEECIGQLAYRTDERQEVLVEEPTGLPADPTRAPPAPPPYFRPPAASPSM